MVFGMVFGFFYDGFVVIFMFVVVYFGWKELMEEVLVSVKWVFFLIVFVSVVFVGVMFKFVVFKYIGGLILGFVYCFWGFLFYLNIMGGMIVLLILMFWLWLFLCWWL